MYWHLDLLAVQEYSLIDSTSPDMSGMGPDMTGCGMMTPGSSQLLQLLYTMPPLNIQCHYGAWSRCLLKRHLDAVTTCFFTSC